MLYYLKTTTKLKNTIYHEEIYGRKLPAAN